MKKVAEKDEDEEEKSESIVMPRQSGQLLTARTDRRQQRVESGEKSEERGESDKFWTTKCCVVERSCFKNIINK